MKKYQEDFNWKNTASYNKMGPIAAIKCLYRLKKRGMQITSFSTADDGTCHIDGIFFSNEIDGVHEDIYKLMSGLV